MALNIRIFTLLLKSFWPWLRHHARRPCLYVCESVCTHGCVCESVHADECVCIEIYCVPNRRLLSSLMPRCSNTQVSHKAFFKVNASSKNIGFEGPFKIALLQWIMGNGWHRDCLLKWTWWRQFEDILADRKREFDQFRNWPWCLTVILDSWFQWTKIKLSWRAWKLWGEPVALHGCTVGLNGREVRALIDTGSMQSLISLELVPMHLLNYSVRT